MQKFKIGMNIREVITAANMNEIADAVNAVKENQNNPTPRQTGGRAYQTGEIRIKNGESSTLEQFSAVSLTGLELTAQNCDSFAFETPTFTAGKVTTARKDMPFAILLEPANSGELSKALVTGVTPAKVTIKDQTHQYAKPTPDSSAGALESCDAGTARILYKAGSSGEQWCILQLGAGGAEAYDGPFALSLDENGKLKCKGGYLNRNGEIVSVSDASGITPSPGYVCVYTNISGQSWTTPEIKIISSVTTGYYPVGYCQMNNNVPALTQYRVAMAIIMITGNCPVNATT